MTDRRGFTLIEVMLAMLILGIGLVVMTESAGRALSVIRKARIYEDARHLIERVQVEEAIDPKEIEEGSDSGSFDGRYGQYRWTREILQEEVEDEEDTYLFRITTKVFWSEGQREFFEEVETFLYAPEAKNQGSF